MNTKDIIKNKDTLMAQKKAIIKYADGCMYATRSADGIIKGAIDIDGPDEIEVKAAINTTNILDSHGDVHIQGLWNKSLKENKMIMHLQEHKMSFDSIISDGEDLKVSAKNMTFKALGYDLDGDTQVLFFESIVKMERNLYMFKQYTNGNVKNHSVGMRYVKMFLAVNDEDYKEEKAIWDKYYPTIANKEDADAQGYFWAITEAKVIEGSAVPIGSNQITPTIEVAAKSTTPYIEPPSGTPDNIYKFLITNLKKETNGRF
jgi:hypothetical protein